MKKERNTRQRDAIREVFAHVHRPLSPQEVLELGKEHCPGLGIATVYRTLNKFIDEGALVHVEIPGQATLYEGAGKHHHHHFHCNLCQKTFEVEGCPGDLTSLTPDGFSLQSHEIVLYGLCQQCNTTSRASV